VAKLKNLKKKVMNEDKQNKGIFDRTYVMAFTKEDTDANLVIECSADLDLAMYNESI
jgi:hypothetical protein